MSSVEEALKGGSRGTAASAPPGSAAAGRATAAAATAGDSSRLPPGATQLLPLVEAFFVLCSLQNTVPPPPGPPPSIKELLQGELGLASPPTGGPTTAAPAGHGTRISDASGGQISAAAAAAGSSGVQRAGRSQSGTLQGHSSSGHGDERHGAFLRFTERHKRLLNAYVRRAPSLLDGSLEPLLRVPRLLDFDNKRAYFKSKVRRAEHERPYGSLRIAVRREHVFEDSFHQLRSRTAEEMRTKLNVQFQGEEGVDAGGVSREWYQVMAREMFNPNLALFVQVPEGGTTFQPNPNSVVQSDRGTNHLDYFRFVGRIIGKALYDGQLVDAYFTRSFYKHLLGVALTVEDIDGVDPDYYKSLSWMLANDITDVLDLTFTAESDFFGRKQVLELVPGGKDIKVTEANKREYVNLIARHFMTTAIRQQIAAFLEGFWELVPRQLVGIFNHHELELLISGLPDIDMADLRAQTEYSGYQPTSPVIRWFWEAVGAMDKEELALLLQFVTGTSKVPLDGFRALQGISGPQRFQIHKAYGAGDRLPSAHTCFNQLDLPEYESKEQLVDRLRVAIHEGAEGFGFG